MTPPPHPPCSCTHPLLTPPPRPLHHSSTSLRASSFRHPSLPGVVVSDDRDGLPLGVCFDPTVVQAAMGAMASGVDGPQAPIADAARARPNAYFALDELLPRGTDATGVSLVELPQRFSTAPTSQLALAGTLGAANLAAVLYLGGMLSSVAGIPVAAMGSSGPLILMLRRLYGPLLVYASGFVAVPAVRAVVNKRRNRAINERNAVRGKWGRAVAGATASAAARQPSAQSGGGLRARLKRKLEAARKLRPRLRRMRTDDDSTFSTASGITEDVLSTLGGGSISGDGFDDFDKRLADAAPSPPPPSPPSPPPPASPP